jgi:invasion protein IalB
MRARMRTTIIALLLLPVLSLAAAAQTPEFLGSHRDWNVYAFTEDSQKICYMASEPTKQEGDYTRRGNPAVLVTRRPGSPAIDEVSVQPGYTFREGSEVEIEIGGRDFMLFTRGEHAWTKSQDADQALINAMKRGSNMTVRGTSLKGTYSLDTYSLLGFTAGYEAMVNACGS